MATLAFGNIRSAVRRIFGIGLRLPRRSRRLRGLPTWQHGYRSVRAITNGRLPGNGERASLTAHGVGLMVLPGVQLLVRGFLAAINVAVAMQRGIRPSVTEPIEVKIAGEDFIRPVNGQAGAERNVDQLFGVLRGEPATWRRVNPPSR